MDFQAVGTFTLLVLLLTIMPGPNGALLLKTVPQNGRRAGMLNLIGIVCAFSAHGAFSIFGLSAFILKTSQAFFIVKLLGACYLSYLGIMTLWQAFFTKHSSSKPKERIKKSPVFQNRRFFLEGFLTNLLNPKASMFYLAVFPQFIHLDGNPIFESLILVGIHSIIVMFWFSFIIIALGRITHTLSSVKFKRIVQGATGMLLLWFGYRLLIYQQKS
ncbi:MAG: LysE family translocator [Desulfobacteraceae bacterium]|nr:LysE family translocator [Desulfobacteraceae bacterium]